MSPTTHQSFSKTGLYVSYAIGHVHPPTGRPRPGHVICQLTLPIGFASPAILIEELCGMPVHLGRLVVNGCSMLMDSQMPALMLLMLAVAVRVAPNPSLSRHLSTA